MKKLIFTQRVEIVESYGERRDCSDQRIAEWIIACGYLPVAIPNIPNIVDDYIDNVSPVGVILTGGNSLVKYGGNAPERDDMDRSLIAAAIERDIPVFGFCRGMQSILDYFGERLVEVSGHVAKRVQVKGRINREVNSYHNQGCTSLNTDNFELLAISEDGVIKAVKHKQHRIIGVMWHPEREEIFAEEDMRLLNMLIEGDRE